MLSTDLDETADSFDGFSAGEIVWTPSIILAGYYAGSAYDTVASALGKVSLAVAAVAIVTWIIWSRRHRQKNPSPHQA